MALKWTITDLGNDIEVAGTGTISDKKYTFNKMTMRVRKTATTVYITNSDSFEDHDDNFVLQLDHTTVSSPSYSDLDDLYNGIIGMIGGVSISGSESLAAGDGVWSNAMDDFTATITASTKNITIAGLSWTFAVINVLLIEKFDSSGKKETLNVNQVTVSGSVITLANIDNFVSGDVVRVWLVGPKKSYDEALDSDQSFVLNPEYAHYTSPEALISLTNAAAGTYRYVIPFESYKNLSIHWDLVGGASDTVTMTFWATNKSAADDTADTDWVDISSTVLGAASKASTSTTPEEDMAFIDTPLIALKFKVKIVVVGGTSNSADVIIKKA